MEIMKFTYNDLWEIPECITIFLTDMSIEVQQAEFERSYIMAKKFGKFLLFTAAVSGAAAGAYYYLKKKNYNSREQ